MQSADRMWIFAAGVSSVIGYLKWAAFLLVMSLVVPTLFGMHDIQPLTTVWYRSLARQMFLAYCLLVFLWALISNLAGYVVDMRDWARHGYSTKDWQPPLAFAKPLTEGKDRPSPYKMMTFHYPLLCTAYGVAVVLLLLGLLGYIPFEIGIGF